MALLATMQWRQRIEQAQQPARSDGRDKQEPG
jgi:hypothetical protein